MSIGVGVATSGVLPSRPCSPPPPREDGARSSVDRTPGCCARFRAVPSPPLALTEYVPITTAVTLCRTRPVDRNTPFPEALFGQLCYSAIDSRSPTDTRYPSRTMLDIPSRVRVHVETPLAAQNDMGVCDAMEQ